MNCVSDYDPELASLLNSFQFEKKPSVEVAKTPLRDVNNTHVSAGKKSEEKSAKARFAPPVGSQEVAAASKSFVTNTTHAKHSGVGNYTFLTTLNFLSCTECATSAELLNMWLSRFFI